MAPNSTSHSQSEPAGDPFSILLAEDNPGDVFIIREVLKSRGLDRSLQIFSRGDLLRDHVRKLESGQGTCPDLILLDLNLPRVSGTDILKEVRGSKRCGQIPVIIVTSSNAPEDRRRTAEAGATDYFQKPSAIEDYRTLAALVLEHLER